MKLKSFRSGHKHNFRETVTFGETLLWGIAVNVTFGSRYFRYFIVQREAGINVVDRKLA